MPPLAQKVNAAFNLAQMLFASATGHLPLALLTPSLVDVASGWKRPFHSLLQTQVPPRTLKQQ
jgi:hypothetical protein